jgi:hypothetical protein
MALKKVGVLWQRKSKSGKHFLSGFIDKGIDGEIAIAVFKVPDKQSEKSPDYVIALVPQAQRSKAEDDTPAAEDDIPLP